MTAMGRSLGLATAVVLALGLTACTVGGEPASTDPVVQLGAPGEPNRTLSPDEIGELGVPEHVDADVTFMLDMIDHHSQALVMTGYVKARTDDRDIRLLAERMEVSQEDEIDQMAQWLQDRAQPLRENGHDGHDGGHEMPGMLTEEQLAELQAAKGDAFDLLFLEYMIQHHQGALQMVQDLYQAGGGQEPGVGQFAAHVEGDQGIEIARMQEMLAERTS